MNPFAVWTLGDHSAWCRVPVIVFLTFKFQFNSSPSYWFTRLYRMLCTFSEFCRILPVSTLLCTQSQEFFSRWDSFTANSVRPWTLWHTFDSLESTWPSSHTVCVAMFNFCRKMFLLSEIQFFIHKRPCESRPETSSSLVTAYGGGTEFTVQMLSGSRCFHRGRNSARMVGFKV